MSELTAGDGRGSGSLSERESQNAGTIQRIEVGRNVWVNAVMGASWRSYCGAMVVWCCGVLVFGGWCGLWWTEGRSLRVD